MTHALSRLTSAALLIGLFIGALSAEEKKPRPDFHGDPLPEGALARLGSLRLRNGEPVSFVAFLPGGKTLLSAGADWNIRVWDIGNGKEVRHFGEREAVNPGQPRIRQPGNNQPLLAALSPDGKMLAACVMNTTETVLWDVAAGKELKRFQITAPSNSIAISPDGKLTAVSCADSIVHLYDREGKEVRSLTSADAPANGRFFGGLLGMAFAPDGKMVVLSGMEFNNGMLKRSIRAWDPTSGKMLYRIETDQRNFYGSAPTFSPDGKTIALGSWSNEVYLFDAATGKELRKFRANLGRLDSLVYASNGKVLIGRSSLDGGVCLWEAATGKEMKTIGKQAGPMNFIRNRNVSYTGATGLISLSEDGKVLAAADGNLIRLLDLSTGKDAIASAGHHGPIMDILFQTGGKSIVTVGGDGTARLWEAASGKETGALTILANAYSFTLSPDGKLMAVECTDASMRIVDTASGKELRRVDNQQRQVLQSAYAFSPDGKLLAMRNRMEGATRVISVETGKVVATLGTPNDMNQQFRFYLQSVALAFAPDGKTLVASGAEGGMIVWDVASRMERFSIASPQGVQYRAVAFSPDGRTFALDMHDNSVVTYELASGLQRRKYSRKAEANPMMGARANIVNYSNNPTLSRTLSYSPDGKYLALAADNRTVHVWDLLSGEEIGELKGHRGEVSTIAFAPDSKTLATGSDDATALIWDVGAFKSKKTQPAKLDEQAVRQFWNDLQAADGLKSLTAIAALSAAPEGTLFLGKTLKTPETVEDSKIEKMIADLDARRFATRKKAQDDLEKLGWMAAPALKKALERKPSEEVRKWVTELLEKTKGQSLSPVQLQMVRAIEALERAGTAEAKAVLERLSQGPGGAMETLEAKAALARIR